MWWRNNRTVQIVGNGSEPARLDAAFLHQPNIRLLRSSADEYGMRLARKERPHLVIEELASPEGSAPLCRRLKDDPATRGIARIVVTAKDARHAVKGIADVVMARPFARREYFEAVRRFIPLPERRTDRVPVNLRFTWTYRDRPRQAFSRDVSSDGVFLRSDVPVPVGASLDLAFLVPGAPRRLVATGVVRFANPGEDGGGFGIEFLELPDDDQEQLDRFLTGQRGRSFFRRRS